MPQDLLIAAEVMPIVKNIAYARTGAELQKAVKELYAAYPEVVKEYLEDEPAPGHKFPGEEEPSTIKGSPFFDYKTGKEGRTAPQSPPEKYAPQVDPKAYMKRLAILVKAFQPKYPNDEGADEKGRKEEDADLKRELGTHRAMRSIGMKAQFLHALRKALSEETKAPVVTPPPAGGAAAMQQERRLCPRCGGAPCYCPDGGGQAGKSADGSAGAGSEETKTVVMENKDVVPHSEPNRPL